MQGFLNGLPFVCIIAEPEAQNNPWQGSRHTYQYGGQLEGALGIAKSKDEALKNDRKEADQRFMPWATI